MVGAAGTDAASNRRRIRLWLVLLAGVMAAGMSGVAAADPPSSGSESGASIFCAGDQQVEVYLGQGNEFAYLEFFAWSEAEEEGVSGFTDDFAYDGTTLQATVDVYAWSDEGEDEGDEQFVGTATIAAVFAPVGDPEVFAEDGRDGNRRFRFSETSQPAEVSGSISLDGVLDLDLSSCEAHQYTYSFWTTNPAASVYRFSGMFMECAVAGPGGSGVLYASTEGSQAFADLYLDTDQGFLFGFTDAATFTDTTLTASIDLYEESFDGEGDQEQGDPVATAQVDATLESQGTETQRIRFPDGRIKETIETFAVTGTMTVDGATWDLDDCVAEAYDVHEQFVDPNGPKMNGRPPSNDLPADAEPLEVGDTVRDRTNTAVPPPEADCTASFTEEGEVWEEEVPLGKTLWYAVTATGTELTIDTTGSDFDTVVGVYDTSLDQVACVDDVEDVTDFSLQAAVTVDTVPGQTYLVQVGGFGYFPEDPGSDPDYGRLLLTVTG